MAGLDPVSPGSNAPEHRAKCAGRAKDVLRVSLEPVEGAILAESAGDTLMEDEAGEESAVKTKRQPLKPSADEVAAHEAGGHYPYRDWCRACVGGAGRVDPHKTQTEEQNAIPVAAMDYGFFTDGESEELSSAQALGAEVPKGATPFLVVKCKPSMVIMSAPVRCKGIEDQVSR